MLIKIIIFFIINLTCCMAFSQAAERISILIESEIQELPTPQIKLKWRTTNTGDTYIISRKLKGEYLWTLTLDSLPGTDSIYIDTNVTNHVEYEYKIEKIGATKIAYGYISSGIKIYEDKLEERGVHLTVVDTTYLSEFEIDLTTFNLNLKKDGFQSFIIYIDQNDSVTSVKSKISTYYNQFGDSLKSVLLLGHVPVPYSGAIAPDGHTNNHKGAWPADTYYADMTGSWTDYSISDTSAGSTRTHNIPGDGKFDQNFIPSDLDLAVGRVDFYSLSNFSQSEGELIKRYLQKNNLYKENKIPTTYRSLIDNNFQTMQEGFASTGLRSFSSLLGIDSVFNLDYRTTLNNAPYIWSFGCGGGSYQNCNGVIHSNNFGTDSIQSIFTVFFGSYFGDFDSNKNLLRSALGSGTNLATCWGNRPAWFFHHMGTGETIGYSSKISQNNVNIYDAGIFSFSLRRGIHTALLGDPTLRMHNVSPPSDLILSHSSPSEIFLSWVPSIENVEGYNVYKSDSLNGVFHKINISIISSTNYTHLVSESDTNTYFYMVRSVKLNESSSGSYYNLSLGTFSNISLGIQKKLDELKIEFYPNPFKNNISMKFKNYQKGLSMNILSINGQSILSKKILKENLIINLESLKKGVYIVNIIDAKNRIIKSKKLIKQ